MLLIKEAFYITLTGQLNRDQGTAFMNYWRPLCLVSFLTGLQGPLGFLSSAETGSGHVRLRDLLAAVCGEPL